MSKEELIITALQQRIGELVSSYETQIAILRAELTEFINTLEGISTLKNVQNTYATTIKDSNSVYATDFEITASYNERNK